MVSWRLSETCARDNWMPKREPAGFGNSAWQRSQRNQESQRQNVLHSNTRSSVLDILEFRTPGPLKCPRKKASFKSSQSFFGP